MSRRACVEPSAGAEVEVSAAAGITSSSSSEASVTNATVDASYANTVGFVKRYGGRIRLALRTGEADFGVAFRKLSRARREAHGSHRENLTFA